MSADLLMSQVHLMLVGLEESTGSVLSVLQALHCCLSDVSPLDGETWSDACTQRFISLAHQKLVTIVATGTVFVYSSNVLKMNTHIPAAAKKKDACLSSRKSL